MKMDLQTEQSIARNALSYDLLPYESKPIPQSHPARLAAMAKIFGLESKPLATARVLELGCASGGNLVPMALNHPMAEFVGIDISPKQVQAGRDRIQRLGLKNLTIRCESFSNFGPDEGKFDYIICHGVFSWVPQVLQDAIFRLCQNHLASDGVAFISYNVLPGWRMLQTLRDAFHVALPKTAEGTDRVKEAAKLLGFLSEASAAKTGYHQALKSIKDKFPKFSAAYVAHEYLEETNDPCLFSDFATRATQYGLGFLAESELQSMIVDQHGTAVAIEIRRRANGDPIATEQLLDLVSGRTFRQTLLVHQKRTDEINRDLEPDRLDGLHLEAEIGMRIENEGDEAKVTLVDGQAFWIKSQAMCVALQKFIAKLPSTSAIESLLPEGSEASDVKRGFRNLMMAGVVAPTIRPVFVINPAPLNPKATRIARADAADHAAFTTNPKHEAIALEPATWFLLHHMDGTRTQSELITDLAAEVRDGRITLYEDGKEVSSIEKAVSFVEQHAVHLIDGLAKAGLLEA